MACQKYNPIYLFADADLQVRHGEITVADLWGMNWDSDDLFFAFERDFVPYQDIVLGTLPRIDLVTLNRHQNNTSLRGLEIKLTALPDYTTCELPETRYGCELVVRPPTIVYLAISIAKAFQNNRDRLYSYLNPICARIEDWTLASSVLPFLPDRMDTLNTVLKVIRDRQIPLVMQPIWKTQGKSAKLHDYCLDIFVWSNIAFTQLFLDAATEEINIDKMSRQKRCVVWLVKMLYDFTIQGQINYSEVIDTISFNTKNDKAFALSGVKIHKYITSPQLIQPRIKKEEIKNIILGGGEKFLSPERRLDAIIMNTPDLFV